MRKQPSFRSLNNQQGIVLFFALVVLLILTVIGTSLAVSSGFSARMATTSAERVESLHTINGSQLRLIDEEAAKQGESLFVKGVGTTSVTDANTGVASDIKFLVETGCRRSSSASSASTFSCRQSEVASQVSFGKNNRGNIGIVSAVEQPVFNVGG
ncbi:pilus assembly PilX family protein [Paraferrimonas haliotis]|uniref:Type 4 fimbrial biogenesis protein PilX N-terminal domain-containing protein n=1 Tax=Paraferrimonas haliotis TaxID=2013866 RepID=A0AA37TN99_9GAMM|nr:pilus assembly PilX N-terminal domain-containing protein [Paraferrimonas haliotis]GLS82560.1 hypothetical protein GCM10007894_05370 [Paraferrimonas haliotis]